MAPILTGIETEYGFTVEGRGAEDQIDDAVDFVRGYTGPHKAVWDYRHESPRADLRGFSVKHLAFDPTDAQFDRHDERPSHDIRSDRILPNGARFYNDHGHPEYATPECWSLSELALHDLAGQVVLQRAANELQSNLRRPVKVYKNNTDFHGASYGTHEGYLVPRQFEFDQLFRAVTPMLVARQVLTGAGKVGSEKGAPCDFQVSQRSDFFSEAANVETLYRRPIFNTRDEPHADRASWIRLHVISGESNMMPACTRRKVGLVKLALLLMQQGETPRWTLRDPVSSFAQVSRNPFAEGRIELEGASWTTPRHVLESYLCVGEKLCEGDPELTALVLECQALLDQRFEYPDLFRRSVDYAAKYWLLDQFRDAEEASWGDPVMQALDLSYHLLDPDEGLYFGLLEAGEVAAQPTDEEIAARLATVFEPTRALARSVAISRFPDQVVTASWGSLVLADGNQTYDLRLDPSRKYPDALMDVESIEDFRKVLEGTNDPS